MDKVIPCLLLVSLTWIRPISGDEIGSSTGARLFSAKWQHHINYAKFAGYKPGQHLVVSRIYPATDAYANQNDLRAMDSYELQVKVAAWGKPFTSTHYSKKKQIRQLLTVTLFKIHNRREMKARFRHVVYEQGKTKLKFSGETIL